MIPYNRQSIDDTDIEAVIKVLRSNYLTTGPMPEKFEKSLSEYTGFKHAAVFNSATSALHCACLALGINEKSLVWVPAITFVATANCVEYCQGEIDLVDIDRKTGNISVEALKEKIIKYKEYGKSLPDAIIVVHYAGQFCDLKSIKKITDKYGIHLIEDASHALGASLPLGWDQYRGEAVIYSFHPVKMITSGEGGAILSNDQDFIKKAKIIGCHGITRDKSDFHYKSDGDWYYEQQYLGYNYRMSDINAALGLNQLLRIDSFVAKRREVASLYETSFKKKKVDFTESNRIGESCYHLFPILLKNNNSFHVFNELRKSGIGVQKHYIPILRHPYYKNKYYFDESEYVNSIYFYECSISLPIFVDFTLEDQSKVIKEVLELCSE